LRYPSGTIGALTALALALAACSGGDPAEDQISEDVRHHKIAVSVSPSSTSLAPGDTELFVASVTATADTSVTWSIQEGAAGGTVTGGGLYTAPSTGGTYHVVVASVANPARTAVATVAVSAPATVSVAVSPTTASLVAGGTRQFSATVTGTSDSRVTWSVREGAAGGTVTAGGLYTAPSIAGTYHVTATSVAAPGVSATAVVNVTAASPGSTQAPVPADRVTAWNPGIRSDGQLGLALGADGLPQRTTVCATVAAGGNIQSAINNCPAGQVVQLAAGTFTVSSTITLTKGVVLRGAGSGGAPSGTTIVKSGGGTVISIGTGADSSCYGGTAYAVTRDAAKGTTTLSVGSAAASFAAGDVALVDVVDDSTIQQGDCTYTKRVSGRSATQRVEIAAVDTATGTLTLSSPLHWGFKATSPYFAQVTRFGYAITRWAGVERLKIQGGTNPSYNGKAAGGIEMANAAYCWVKDVQTDGTNGGMHVAMTGTYRCVVRDSNFHHSANYGFGADCYGIVLRCGAADNLVENNIVRWMNKPILFNVSGGGNVIAYNYADNSWATPSAWQEVNIDSHCSFPHMELMEGNYAPHMGASNTHGNAGYLTYFRNYASGKFASPAVYGSTATQNGNVTALEFDGGDFAMNALGNVLGTPGLMSAYDGYSSGTFSIYQLGAKGAGSSDVAVSSLYRHGNYDTVNNQTMWNATVANHTLPPSMYLTAKPGWWPAGTAWPWAGPDLSPMVGTLPAKARSDAMP
jgi:hypothetical protein